MSTNPSVSRALSRADVTAVLVAMAAGVLLGPALATAEDSQERGLTWETSVGAIPSWALLDAPPAASVESPQQATAGADVTDDYVFVFPPDLGLGMDVNNQRQVVGLDTLTQGGVLIDHGVVTPIMVPGSFFTQPTNINEQGEIVGHFRPTEESPMMGFHRDRDGVFTTIVYPDPAAESTFLWGLNDQGDIVGDFRTAEFVQTPFILDQHGDFAILDVPGDGNAVALGINNRGTISGWFLDEAGVSKGYLLEGEDASVVVYPGAFSSDVGRVNNNGLANGIHFTPPMSAGSYLRTEEGEFFDFVVPGFGATLMRGINDHGDQCGAVSIDLFSPPQGFAGFRYNADLDGDDVVG
ncbi:MAG: hypothetical protein HKO59_11555, partial [Phycisphaerales bacterium]|nr:hypothetical protein [Phycisphaerales bacterium]